MASLTILVFGATGSAGGSVLRACLDAADVREVRALTRRPLGTAHAKLREIVHDDFTDYTRVAEAFAGVDACLFCLGVSVTQVPNEAAYRAITHDITMAAARALAAQSPTAALHYISGQGTDPGGRMMWMRVKGALERQLMDEFGAVCWRPAFIDGEASDRAPWMLKVATPLLRLLKPFARLYVDGRDLGRAMLHATRTAMRSRIVENPEIRAMAASSS